MKRVYKVWTVLQYNQHMRVIKGFLGKNSFTDTTEKESSPVYERYVLADNEEEAGKAYIRRMERIDRLGKLTSELAREESLANIFEDNFKMEPKGLQEYLYDVTETVTFQQLIADMSAEDLSEYCRERLLSIQLRG